MFNLEEKLSNWRASLPLTLRENRELLEELESHLRDAFERQMKTGKSAEDSWSDALSSMGDTQNVAREFAKVHRQIWWPAWIAALLLVVSVGSVLALTIARFSAGAIKPLLATHVVLITAGYVSMFAIGLLGSWAVLVRGLRGWSDRQEIAFESACTKLSLFALITTLIGCFLGAWWARDYLGRWWGWDPKEIGGLCVLAWACVLLQSFRSHRTPAQLRLCNAIIANMIVATGWFGPALITIHSYPVTHPTIGMLLAIFLVIQVVFIWMAQLPEGGMKMDRRAAHL